ncbi:MAG: 6-carboxytetrahydropterin synthase [Armatimonadetes bacterium]|nr:6-carboxytetrahydropterin synthase [Armatimonadota bacterium]
MRRPVVLISRRVAFEAAHSYWLADLSAAENRRLFGSAASPSGHGHNYVCEAAVAGPVDPRSGLVANIAELNRRLRQVTDELDHRFINREHPYFQHRAPTCENLAAYVWQQLWPGVGGRELRRVRLAESRRLRAVRERTGQDEMTTLTRSYGFSAAHRLVSPHLSEAENREVFGKCFSSHGHGHDYVLEVTVGGEVDERTGMLIDLEELDQAVQEEVIGRYDGCHLNDDTEDFARLNPSSENLVHVVWERLRPRLGARLRKVGVHETERNYFEYVGDGDGAIAGPEP